ncbi:MAG: alkaline phosphatase family protein [Polyangiaceae bacterium]|nr:alkaline phosphatase family protein [Polyangiaceae bacterium]
MWSGPKARKVLLLEFNEITWKVAERFMGEGKMPTLARLRAEGTAAAPEALERPPHLDPWISWVTLHTGVDMSEHGAMVLEQDVSTIRAKRTWDYALEAGKSIGIYGSISAYPPRPVPGFMVPGPFAPGPETYPRFVGPAQALNRKYTQVHHKNAEADSLLTMAKMGVDLLKLGLTPETCVRIAAQLATERVKPYMHWKRVALQPYVNFDFFSKLYGMFKPDFATWHSNHAAHYQHHYWRAWDDTGFAVPSTPEEKKKFGGAMPHGYQVIDDLLNRFLRIIDDDTVLVVTSALGQKPYTHDLYPEGKVCVKFKNVRQILEIVGATGVGDVVPVMDPQWNVRISDATERSRVRDALLAVRRDNAPTPDGITVDEVGEILTITPRGLAKMDGQAKYHFPLRHGSTKSFTFDELFRGYGDTPKEGMHDPTGMMLMYGPGIERGLFIEHTTDLDVAPTLLALMGIGAPENMQGRALSEAWGDRPSTAPRASAGRSSSVISA